MTGKLTLDGWVGLMMAKLKAIRLMILMKF